MAKDKAKPMTHGKRLAAQLGGAAVGITVGTYVAAKAPVGLLALLGVYTLGYMGGTLGVIIANVTCDVVDDK